MTPENLQEAVERFRALCQADPRIVAAFVGGSLATGTADEYSDIDVYLIVADEAYASFFADRAAFMRQLGDPVFLEDFDGFGFDMVLFIFEDGIKGELALAKASSFLHIHGGAYRVLVDETGLLKGVTFPIERVPVEEQRQNLIEHLKFFWRGFLVMSQALGRGNLLSAATYLEGVRRRLVSVCRLAVDFQDGGGHPRLEAMLPSHLQEALCGAFPLVEREAMVEAARRMADLFQQVARPLAAQQKIDYPDALEQTVLAWFDEEFAKLGRQATG
ncbi:MAG: aminoglycoside 6-adenylyltransferase [Anaerolineae bacterium]